VSPCDPEVFERGGVLRLRDNDRIEQAPIFYISSPLHFKGCRVGKGAEGWKVVVLSVIGGGGNRDNESGEVVGG